MLRPVCEEAGLGMPPIAFTTTNASETLSSAGCIKEKNYLKKTYTCSFINHLKELIDEQDREVVYAVIGIPI